MSFIKSFLKVRKQILRTIFTGRRFLPEVDLCQEMAHVAPETDQRDHEPFD